MQNCYTVGHDSIEVGIAANLVPGRDYLIVGLNGHGVRVPLSSEEPPFVKGEKIMEAHPKTERDEFGTPRLVLASTEWCLDAPVVIILLDTSRSARRDDETVAICPHAGSPHTFAETLSPFGDLLSAQGLYALSAGDAVCMRPLGVCADDWTNQRVVYCDASNEGALAVKVLSRAQYKKHISKLYTLQEDFAST